MQFFHNQTYMNMEATHIPTVFSVCLSRQIVYYVLPTADTVGDFGRSTESTSGWPFFNFFVFSVVVFAHVRLEMFFNEKWCHLTVSLNCEFANPNDGTKK